MGKTIGIDLGTTNTCVAVLKDGRPTVLKDEKGYKVLPSVVSMKGEGRYVVGQQAKNLILTNPTKTVYAIKRLMGRRFDSPEASRVRERMAYTIEASPEGLCQIVIDDVIMSPIEISSVVLRMAKQVAERTLGEEVSEAVITVPAYFNHGQRAATLEAAKLAGLHCERLLNEPTSAALAYGYRKDVEKTILIFDLGGGTFDVSVLHMSHGVYEILASTGDTFLGGEDFDFAIVDWMAAKHQKKYGEDLREDTILVQRLKDAAERAKCELSFMDKTAILIPQIKAGVNLEAELTRTELEELTTSLVDRTVEITREAVSASGLQISDIDDVILVGGQTRMPRVRELITNLFGKEPSRSVHPEEVVAIGAAVHAESLDDPEKPAALLIDVTPFDLGIDTAGGFFSAVIDRNSKIPTYHTRTFTTVNDNQETVKITVRQGGSSSADENEFLGEFVLTGLRPAPKMAPKLDVTFRIDANGMLHVTATERATGERQQIIIRNYAEAAVNPGSIEAERLDDGSAATAAAAGAEKGAKKLLSRLFKKKPKKKKKSKKDDKAAAEPADTSPEVIAPSSAAPGIVMPSVAAAAGAAGVAASALGADELEELPADSLEVLPDSLGNEPLDLDDDLFAMPDDDPIASDDLFAAPEGEEHDAFANQAAAEPEEDDPFANLGDDFGGLGDDLFGGLGDDEPAADSGDLDLGDDLFSLSDEPAAPAAAADGDGLDDLFGLDDFGLDDLVDDAGAAAAASAAAAAAAAAASDDDLFASGGDDLDSLDFGDDMFAMPSDDDDDVLEPIDDQSDLLSAAGGLLDELGGDDVPAKPAPTYEEPLPVASSESDPFAALGEDFGLPGEIGAPEPTGELSDFGLPGDIEPEPLDLDELDLEPEPLAIPEPAPAPPRPAPKVLEATPKAPAPPPRRRKKKKKPARLKISYRKASAFAKEYKRNLDSNGTFIKTGKPLPINREVVFQISVPGLEAPLVFGGKVISNDAEGSAPGMRIQYTMDSDERTRLETAVQRLGR